MTQSYGLDENGDEKRFHNSQFLVFVNRILAFCVAYLMQVSLLAAARVAIHRFSYPAPDCHVVGHDFLNMF